MKYLFMFIFVFICSNVYADQKVFYDVNTGKHVTDVSGQKTIKQIRDEFGLESLIEATLSDDEAYRIKNNTIDVYDYKKEQEDNRESKETKRQQKEDSIKQKLGLTDKEFKDLKEALQ